MDSNATAALDATSGGSNPQQATGRSVFWAVAAIALNAMLQPSFVGHLISGDIFRGTLWPHRSSPPLCLIDAYVDVRFVVQQYRKAPSEEHDEAAPVKSTAVILRLAIFVLGVLPQVVKIFSMRGIPLSQALAAVYLVSSLCSTVRTLHVEDGDEAIVDLVGRIDSTNGTSENQNTDAAVDGAAERSTTKRESSPSDLERTQFWIGVAGLVPHAGLVYWIWGAIRIKASLTVTEHVFFAVDLARFLSESFIDIWGAQFVLYFMILGKVSPLPRLPIVWLLTTVGPWSVVRALIDLEARSQSMTTLTYVLNAAACSYALAYVMHVGAERLRIRRGRRAHSSSEVQTDLPMTVISNTTPRTSTETQAPIVQTSNTQPETTEEAEPPQYSETDVASHSDDIAATEHDPDEGSDAPPPYSEAEATSLPAAPSPAVIRRRTQESSQLDNENSVSSRPNADATQPVAQGSQAAPEEKPSTLFNILMYCIVGPFIILVIVLDYAGLGPGLFVAKDEAEAAEEGEITPRPEGQSESSSNRRPASASNSWSVYRVLWAIACFESLRLLVRYTFIGIWRIYVAANGLVMYPLNWLWHWVLAPRKKDVMWVAFGVLNLMTAAMYYLIVFDGKGTRNPSWTSVLG